MSHTKRARVKLLLGFAILIMTVIFAGLTDVKTALACVGAGAVCAVLVNIWGILLTGEAFE